MSLNSQDSVDDYDSSMLIQIENLKNKYPKSWGRVLASERCKELLAWLFEKTPLLNNEQYSLATKVWWVEHDLKTFPKCPICGKEMHKNIVSPTRGYFRVCSRECAAADPKRQEKIASTTFEHYGCRNYFTSEEGKSKREEWLKKNGVENAFQLEEVKNKSKKSRKKNFGYEHTMQSPEKRDLARANYRKKTGYEHQFFDPEVKKRIKARKQEKIEAGIDEKEAFRKNWRKKRYKQLVEFDNEVHPLFSFDEYKDCTRKSQYKKMFKWHCDRCGKDFDGFLDPNLITREHLLARCPNCHPILCGTSKPEMNVVNFLKSAYSGEIVERCRTLIPPLEVDCYLPEKKLAIEFDGLYFHSEVSGQKSKPYHLNKTSLCEA